eukprot:TRINITY_DN5394_c0_g1_i1.p2 TRINITY_DN5394_c0_g1~~TRINITY_DN5394_c0_g1_i1.p2  ORF type:complete len:413 (+),score=95.28 TRINITY_DN5394_c0_g1_i1:95-1333(+)
MAPSSPAHWTEGTITPADAGRLLPLLSAKLADACEPSDSRLRAWCDERTMLRYIVAQIHNKPRDKAAKHVAHAAEQLIGTLRWRAKTRPEEVRCSWCRRDPTSHPLRIVGTDVHGRPVAYTCYAQAMHRTDVEPNVEHMLWCMEECVWVMEQAGAKTEQWVWCVDFHGYSMWTDASPSTASRCAQLLAHYPERLGRALLIDAGRLFEGTWAVVRRIINERTSSKVGFVRLGDLAAELDQFCSAELQQWLLREVEDNRRRRPPVWEKDRSAGKCWWVPPSGGGHDGRGTQSHLASPLFRYPPWLADIAPSPRPHRTALRRSPPQAPRPHPAARSEGSDTEPDLVTAVEWDSPRRYSSEPSPRQGATAAAEAPQRAPSAPPEAKRVQFGEQVVLKSPVTPGPSFARTSCCCAVS